MRCRGCTTHRRYEGLPGADAHYNLGNALAKQGRYDDAIAAYDAALRAKPGMPDAIANKKAVEAAKKRKPPPGQGQRDDPRSENNDADKKQQGQQQQGQGTPKPNKQDGQGQQPQVPSKPGNQKPDQPRDAQAQRAADAAQRERMERALQQGREAKQAADKKDSAPRNETPQARERRLANEAWMRRVPDDPGGLLRAKFRLEYERRQLEGED